MPKDFFCSLISAVDENFKDKTNDFLSSQLFFVSIFLIISKESSSIL